MRIRSGTGAGFSNSGCGKARSLVFGDDSRVWHASSGPESSIWAIFADEIYHILQRQARWIVVDILSALNNAFSRCVFN